MTMTSKEKQERRRAEKEKRRRAIVNATRHGYEAAMAGNKAPYSNLHVNPSEVHKLQEEIGELKKLGPAFLERMTNLELRISSLETRTTAETHSNKAVNKSQAKRLRRLEAWGWRARRALSLSPKSKERYKELKKRRHEIRRAKVARRKEETRAGWRA